MEPMAGRCHPRAARLASWRPAGKRRRSERRWDARGSRRQSDCSGPPGQAVGHPQPASVLAEPPRTRSAGSAGSPDGGPCRACAAGAVATRHRLVRHRGRSARRSRIHCRATRGPNRRRAAWRRCLGLDGHRDNRTTSGSVPRRPVRDVHLVQRGEWQPDPTIGCRGIQPSGKPSRGSAAAPQGSGPVKWANSE
jgi:hypothetical protein